MKTPRKLTKVTALIVLEAFLLVFVSQGLNALATRSAQDTMAPTTTSLMLTPQAPILFSDEFDGNGLDLSRWEVYTGTPTVSGGWLTLPGAEIQSKREFVCGTLQGVIQSSDWKPHDEFTDSSFGFEIWEGADGKCHHGVVFKANGHLGLLRSKPDTENKCEGQSEGIPGRDPDDPYYQDYLAIPNWNAITATDTITFTLTWSKSVTLEVSGGQFSGQVYTDTSPTIPTVPLKIRLYAQPTETYNIDYIRLYACHVVYLPIILHQYSP
jgi:hypothetical protein